MDVVPDWSYQQVAVDKVLKSISEGKRLIVLTGPTGCGKTKMMGMIADEFILQESQVQVYSHRRSILKQLTDSFVKSGFRPGIRTADDNYDPSKLLQIGSLQTVNSRVMKRCSESLHKSNIVLVDEVHDNNGPSAQRVLARHMEDGAVVIGFTATPLDLCNYQELIVAATTTELIRKKVLVPAWHYAPDEPALKSWKRQISEDNELDRTKAIMRGNIFGRVIDNWRRYNPRQRPTILFAPGVPESMGFAKHFVSCGISAAHIDGEVIWENGRLYDSKDPEERRKLFQRLAEGQIKILSNRYICREGIDIPEVECIIFATIFGNIGDYLQAGGRGLRASWSTAKQKLTVIDHGGNYWRYGSLNADRQWDLRYTDKIMEQMRAEAMRNANSQTPNMGEPMEEEPFVCPACNLAHAGGSNCLGCGQSFLGMPKTRFVVQHNGEIKAVLGDIFKPRVVKEFPDTQKLWAQVFWRCRNAKNRKISFAQAVGLFVHLHNYWPPRSLDYMPIDWHYEAYLPIKEVPGNRIRWPSIPKSAHLQI